MDQRNVRWGLATAVVLAAMAAGVAWTDPADADSPSDPAAVRAYAANSTRESAGPKRDDACGTRQRARSVADVIDPAQWYLTLPTGKAGGSGDRQGHRVAHAVEPGVPVRPAGAEGVEFRATAGGVTTKNSDYPRSELREEVGGEHAGLVQQRPARTRSTCARPSPELPEAKPHVVTAQIHDTESDVMRGPARRREADGAGTRTGKKDFVLDPAYELGTPYAVRDHRRRSVGSRVSYNGEGDGHDRPVGAAAGTSRPAPTCSPTPTRGTRRTRRARWSCTRRSCTMTASLRARAAEPSDLHRAAVGEQSRRSPGLIRPGVVRPADQAGEAHRAYRPTGTDHATPITTVASSA